MSNVNNLKAVKQGLTMILINRQYSIAGNKLLESISPYSVFDFFNTTMNEISDIDDSYSFAKTYIKFGQECCICLEPVTSTLNGWKTKCGQCA